jgi:hypothetical protein
MASKQTNCIYCGQTISLTYEQGRPKALQNGRVHKCTFSKLGLRSGEADLNRESGKAIRGGRKSSRAGKWAFWGGLFG